MKNNGVNKAGKVISDVLGGTMFSKDNFVSLFPFFFYVVGLLMLYITNVYIAEITRITKQSNLAVMLKDKGIKESVEPLRKIVVEEGGRDE